MVVHCAAGAGGVTLSCGNGFTQAARPGWYGEKGCFFLLKYCALRSIIKKTK